MLSIIANPAARAALSHSEADELVLNDGKHYAGGVSIEGAAKLEDVTVKGTARFEKTAGGLKGCLMDEDEPTDEISRIEARLDQLGEIAERCRKIILASKVAIATGAGLLLLMLLGLLGSSPVVAIGAMAAVLGGIVSLGSNVSTMRQTMAEMAAAEGLRSQLIDSIDLRLVGDYAADS